MSQVHLYEGWQQVEILEPGKIESDDSIIEMEDLRRATKADPFLDIGEMNQIL